MTTALTKEDLISSLQKEVRILQHLASKIEPGMLDYRPTPKQRSTMELLRYMAIMGPQLVKGIKKGGFDIESWQAAQADASMADFDGVVKMIARQKDEYAALLGECTEQDFQGEIEMFGRKASRASYLADLVLCGHAAYRTQLFLYLKSCGRDELTTANLWQGADQPATV